MSDTKRITSAIATKEKAILDSLTKKLKMTQGEVIGYLLRSYEQLSNRDPIISLESYNLSGSEQKEVEDALVNSDSQIDDVARDGLLHRARYLNSIADKQAQLESMSEEELNNATFKGAANYRIEQAIATIMDHNNNQSEKSQKLCLTKGMVFKLTGSNRQTINKYFDSHEIMISDHNSKHGLTDKDNRKGKGFDVEALLSVV